MSMVLVLEIVCTIAMLFCAFMLVKVNNAGKNQKYIANAIFRYNVDLIHRNFVNYLDGGQISYTTMESFGRTLWRLWDWGYTRIVDKETFEKIKPYI